MRGSDCLRLALGNLRQSPLRTALCALSVAVGTGALLLIAALGLFGNAQVHHTLQTLGISGLTVSLDERTEGNALTAQVVSDLQHALPQVTSATPIKAKTGNVRAGHRSSNAVFLGVNEQLGEVMQLELIAGTLPTARQVAAGDAVAVVDDALARSLYGRENITGRTVRLRMDGQDRYFTVAGVVRAQTSGFGSALSALAPHLIYVPYTCLASASDNADQVFVQCAAEANADAVGTQITRYLSERKRLGGTVRVQNMSGMITSVQRLTELCVALFVAVGGVMLVVALIGVLCSMLASTHERTGEIGVYLALGARRRDIMRLFLLQSVLLCMAGGAIGLGAVALILYYGAALTLPSAGLFMGLLLLSVLCGAAAGLLPALRAANLCPVDAMRK